MNNAEPVARIFDIQQISYSGKGSNYAGTSSSFNNIETVKLSEVDFNFLSLEMLIFRPTALLGTFMRMKAHKDIPLYVGDIVYNGTDIVSAIEFFIGGRVGINSSTSVEIVNERSVADYHRSPLRRVMQNATLWQKAEAKTLKQPLEIQTNGGVFGIKG
jgi:hypothetical protein